MDPCTHGGARVHGMYVVVYLGIRKVGKALNRGHALMHMLTWKHITIAHTKASIEGIPPKNINTDIIWKQIMSRLKSED